MDQLSFILSAIAHPSRRAILAQLSSGPARVTDIAEPFEMSLNAISKHLKVLEQAGLVKREKQGRDHVIELEVQPLAAVAKWLHPYEKFWSRHLDRLELLFENKNGKIK